MSAPPPGIADSLREAAALLGGDSPRLDAELLLAFCLERERSYFYSHGDEALTPAQAECFQTLISRRRKGEPLAYILGRKAFWTLDLKVDPRVLIPRPETELVVEMVLEQASTGAHHRLLDLGTGSGAIALALAAELPQSRVLGVDQCAQALQLARENACINGIDNASFQQSDWFSTLPAARFHVIVSNPPYVDREDPDLQAEVLQFEPAAALFAAEDGLAALEHICKRAPDFLFPGGVLVLEHGWRQGDAVRQLLANAGFRGIATREDLAGRERASLGYVAESSAEP